MAINTPPPSSPRRGLRGLHLSKEIASELMEAADLFVKGGSPWQSIRALAPHFNVDHKTAGDHVRRAGRRKASQQRTTDCQSARVNSWRNGDPR
jgi:hypothetical protein